MISRRDVVTDSAIAVVAEQGVRGLTHRAVDALAELPVGSTSNVYRTRDALITGIMERIGELNSQQLELMLDQVQHHHKTADAAAVDFCMSWLTEHRNRYHATILLSLDPGLPTEAMAAKQRLMDTFVNFVMRFGQVDADTARRIAGSLTGMMVCELVSGTADRDHVEAYISEFLLWLRSAARDS